MAKEGIKTGKFALDPSAAVESMGLSGTVPGGNFMQSALPGMETGVEAGTGAAASGGATWGQLLTGGAGALQGGTALEGGIESMGEASNLVSGGLKGVSAIPGPHVPFTLGTSLLIDLAGLGGVFDTDKNAPMLSMWTGMEPYTVDYKTKAPASDDEVSRTKTVNPAERVDYRSEKYEYGFDENDFQSPELSQGLINYTDNLLSSLSKGTDLDVNELLSSKQRDRGYSSDFVHKGVEDTTFNELASKFSRGLFRDYGRDFAEAAFDSEKKVDLLAPETQWEGMKKRVVSSPDFVQKFQDEDETFGEAWMQATKWLKDIPEDKLDEAVRLLNEPSTTPRQTDIGGLQRLGRLPSGLTR